MVITAMGFFFLVAAWRPASNPQLFLVSDSDCSRAVALSRCAIDSGCNEKHMHTVSSHTDKQTCIVRPSARGYGVPLKTPRATESTYIELDSHPERIHELRNRCPRVLAKEIAL